MNKKVVDRYINELKEMDDDELLFEFEFCGTQIERLMKIVNNGPYEQQLLSCEMTRKRICKEVILDRMGGNN